MPQEQLFKVLVVGQSKVGKTAFVQRYVQGHFTDGYKVTIGVDFAMKKIEWSSDQIVRLQFWDIQGQENTLPFTRAFYREADGCIIMFDVTSDQSFRFCKLLKQAVDVELADLDGNSIPCILLGNKSDLTHRVISGEETADFSSTLKCTAWQEISVKENRNVEESVRTLVDTMLERKKPQREPASHLLEETPIETHDRFCC